VLICETGSGQIRRCAPDGKLTTVASGLGEPLGIAVHADGSCYVTDATGGRLLHIHNGSTGVVLRGLQSPHGVAVAGDEVFVLDRGARTLSRVDARSGTSEVIASNLPVGATPGITPKALPGIAGVMPGPLLPFADLTATADGRVLIGADGAGAVLAIARD